MTFVARSMRRASKLLSRRRGNRSEAFGVHGMGGSARTAFERARRGVPSVLDSESLRYISKGRRRRSLAAHARREETRDESRGGTAAWTPREFLLGHVVGQFVMLGLIAVGLICGGTVAWIACGRSRTEDYNRSLREALWFSWGVFFDPGTQTSTRTRASAGRCGSRPSTRPRAPSRARRRRRPSSAGARSSRTSTRIRAPGPPGSAPSPPARRPSRSRKASRLRGPRDSP